MIKFEDYGVVELPYSSMSICFALLNSARIYTRERNQDVDDLSFLTGIINHIGTITTRDFQIEIRDLYEEPKPCIPVDPNILLNVVWNYGSYYLNALHPEYQQGDLPEPLLHHSDVSTLQNFMNDIARKNQIEVVFSKQQLYQRIYDLQKEKQRHSSF